MTGSSRSNKRSPTVSLGLQLALAKAAGLLSATAEAFHLRWSRRRRAHQANARWYHYQRHIRLALG
jgi:hypothetical protein